jgi:hypothetical protein
MSVGVESRRSSSINFALVQKGKSVIVKVSYDSAGDMLLAQRAWQQMQVAAGGGDESAVDELRQCAAEAAHAQAGSIVDGDSVSSDTMATALKCIKSPEWHKNGATLRLPDGHANAIQILTTLARDFESCVQQQLARAEEDDAVAAPALPPRPLHAVSPAAAPQAAPLQVPVGSPDHHQRALIPLSDSTNARAAAAKKNIARTVPPADVPAGVTLKQIGAAEYYAELPCDRGTMRQIAGSKWRRMVQHLKPRALVERWCKYDKVFQVKGARDDVIHTVNMLFDEIQRFKSGEGRSEEDFEVPHG